MTALKLKGSIYMARPSYSADATKRRMLIEVTDERSGVRFLDIELTAENFLVALTNGRGECEMTLRGLDKIGMKYESKRVAVQFDPYNTSGLRTMGKDGNWHLTAKGARAVHAALKEHEVNGWMAHEDDLFNGHNIVRGSKPMMVTVNFHRFVDPLPEEEET